MNCIVNNESGDYYVIPFNKRADWYDWLMASEYESEVPVYAVYIGGFPENVKFDTWEIIE